MFTFVVGVVVGAAFHKFWEQAWTFIQATAVYKVLAAKFK